jgi:hypothetical protein
VPLDEAMKLTRRHFGTIYLLVAILPALLAAVTVVAVPISARMAGLDAGRR